jgi:hypothetical protein
MGVSAFLPACGDSPSGSSPFNSVATPSPPATPPSTSSPTYTLSGVVTDAGSHAGIRGALVELLTSFSATLGVTDNTGAFAISGLIGVVYRVRVSASGYDSREQIVDVVQNTRRDFELRPPVAPSADYAGVWTGVYGITDCHDLDVPGLPQFRLCPGRSQSYQFTLTQTGTLVSGSYKLVTSFYSCPCQLDGGYGEIPMAGSVSPDGTLAITALGNTRGLVGATAELDLLLRQTSSSTITGTGTLHLRFGTTDDRSIGSVVIRSGTRTQ